MMKQSLKEKNHQGVQGFQILGGGIFLHQSRTLQSWCSNLLHAFSYMNNGDMKRYDSLVLRNIEMQTRLEILYMFEEITLKKRCAGQRKDSVLCKTRPCDVGSLRIC